MRARRRAPARPRVARAHARCAHARPHVRPRAPRRGLARARPPGQRARVFERRAGERRTRRAGARGWAAKSSPLRFMEKVSPRASSAPSRDIARHDHRNPRDPQPRRGEPRGSSQGGGPLGAGGAEHAHVRRPPAVPSVFRAVARARPPLFPLFGHRLGRRAHAPRAFFDCESERPGACGIEHDVPALGKDGSAESGRLACRGGGEWRWIMSALWSHNRSCLGSGRTSRVRFGECEGEAEAEAEGWRAREAGQYIEGERYIDECS